MRIFNQGLRFKVCRGYFTAEALKYVVEERKLKCAGKVKLQQKGKYLKCPDCGWTTIYDIDGSLMDPPHVRTCADELEDLKRKMTKLMDKKKELERIMRPDQFTLVIG